MSSDIDINTIRDLNLKVSAYKYASDTLGDSPCKACNKFNTPDGLLDISRYSEFAKCVDNLSCDAAKEYYEKYNNYVKQYLEEHECNND
jgi:hypothetical protein